MDSAEPGEQRIVLFDFDGVLTRSDTFGLFMRERYAGAWWRKALLVPLVPGLLLLWPLSRSWALRVLVRLGLLGLDMPHYQLLARAFADRLVRQPNRFHREGLAALRGHQAVGDRVIVVTGCEEGMVCRVLQALGIGDVEVLASRLVPGRLGLRNGWHNVGRRKVALLAAQGIKAWAVAYSDSAQDLPMLTGASEPVLVNASPKLCKRVERALGRSVKHVEWYATHRGATYGER